MKLLSVLLTFVLFFSISTLQAQKSKRGGKGNTDVDSSIITDSTPPKVEEEKPKKNKITDQMFMDRLDQLEGQLIALQGILVKADSIPDMSPYMLRSEHEATEHFLEELQTALKFKEIEFTEAINKLNAELITEKAKITNLIKDKSTLSDLYNTKQKEVEALNDQIRKSKTSLDDEHKANQKITNDLVVAFLKQETADVAVIQKMIALDKELNSGKHHSDLNNFNDIQKLIVQGRAILNKALNIAEITKYKSDILAASGLKTKYAKSFVVISEITDQIEGYIEATCSIQRKVNLIIGSNLNAEQKKAKMKSKIKAKELEDIKSNFSYLYNEIEHTKKTLQWRIVFKCD